MRINRFVALSAGLSRRAADTAIAEGRVMVGAAQAKLGQQILPNETVFLDGKQLEPLPVFQTVILNKPPGYVTSRDGQGSKTVYDLLPKELHHLKPVGRLDKNSSGLLLLTNDGDLAYGLTHPKHRKTKRYRVVLDRSLKPQDRTRIQNGIQLPDGISKFNLIGDDKDWTVEMEEGRNRQIRRTFKTAGYTVTLLHRSEFGPYTLETLPLGKHRML